ncbi:MAG: DNA-directed RNA polymerase subunit B [Nitrososphaerota archaeon]|jgi:DNA-directed RNA polymerase subunit B|uniref:DNA-directed RNA polymerase subunit B n=1 Tax=Candidatus Bathycorpusculum sp. TaxID=2994959 RepID=UPI00282A0BFB|nr:DNA-directed RNA polymerase subunit B [Candidatus Termiticorpusculum sp.]MCL2257399.1 DNA-directed RNA polymerase subunit B [Candidatus Termiticorpusculum sp.]MCL2292450.1 DNA-directed RNA polymerase subunit B [Candidatus Termiticorpusculum sp.]MDR0460062.1 DNA-directed RNA polymerase subunit B [Nitrososphaerota archaeon]
MTEIQKEDTHLLLKAFFNDKGLVRQHLDSYNEFIDHGLQEVVGEIAEIPIEVPDNPYKVKLGQIWVIDPQSRITGPYVTEVDGTKHEIHPMEARLRNLAYSAPIALEMTPVIDGREQDTELVYIGNIPVMLKSKLCLLSQLSREELVAAGEDPDDSGGYFVVNGSERVIVAMEDLAPNRVIVDIDDKGTSPIYQAKIFSTTVGFRARIELKLKSDDAIYVTMPGVPTEIPFVVIMRALSMEKDKDIAEAVSLDKDIQAQLAASFEKAVGVDASSDAVLFIGNRVAHGQVEEYRIQKAETAIDKNFLPHIGRNDTNRKEKAIFLGEMAYRVIQLKMGIRQQDDKDHFKNKRLRLGGPLLADLFRVSFRNLTRDIKYQLERIGVKGSIITVSAAVRPGIITERFQHALATGNWGRGRVGVTQLLDRTNYISTLSHLRRLQSPLSRSQPNFEARDLHPTHWGRLCPNETPEGSNCGLVKNLALSATIAVGVNPDRIKQILFEMGTVPAAEATFDQRISGAKVFVDGNIIGYHSTSQEMVKSFRAKRRSGAISTEVNITYFNKSQTSTEEVHTNSDEGRVRRPLIIVENGTPKLQPKHIEKIGLGEWVWEDIVKAGYIEYLDAEEEENAFIAISYDDIKPETTHLEIATYTVLGICASTIPYPEHNQSPRNSYQAAMAKQALGVYGTNFHNRTDTRSHILHYPQVPLVQTENMDVMGYKQRPTGQNCIVAVLSFEGYNMEDAIIFNQAAIQRGLFRSTFYRIYEAECRQYLGGLKDKFTVPEAGTRGFRGEQYYRLLEPDGIISLESQVVGGDVLIGRISPPRFLEEYKEFEVKGPSMRDTSIDMRPSETGIVDGIFVTESGEGSQLVKVRVRDQRIPELGDKFASRHGQKGVIGLIVPPENMPFTDEGITPDLIINPHAIPSRMTIGQFIESLSGKAAAARGKPGDGTPFSNESPTEVRNNLVKLGFSHTGGEVFYNGTTGEKFVADIFVGVVYYQKLHHMVADKIHARARGQVQMLTRQPTEGRARGGGLRFGEMERDCLIGHGAAMLLRDRLLEESDKYTLFICETCGQIAYFDMKQRRYVCKICDEKVKITPVTVSYAFKLLLQELQSLCITPKLKLKEKA